MHTDIVDLREFYLSPLGLAAQRLLRARLRSIWPHLRGEKLLALGYATPLLRPFLAEAGLMAAMMPAAQGVSYWPREGPNLSALADPSNLPLADNAVDRVILMHALEGSHDPHGVLREVWRVMKSGGRALVIVPNRRGFWAHSDRTPFGSGQPYSSFQIKDTLREQGFLVDRMWRALYLPPTQSRFLVPFAGAFEKYGEKIFPGFGGLLVLEAGKQLYAPTPLKARQVSSRMVLPLPLPASPGTAPAG